MKKIGSTARYEIEKMLDCKVNLKLWVKVKKDWRDSEYLMKKFWISGRRIKKGIPWETLNLSTEDEVILWKTDTGKVLQRLAV